MAKHYSNWFSRKLLQQTNPLKQAKQKRKSRITITTTSLHGAISDIVDGTLLPCTREHLADQVGDNLRTIPKCFLKLLTNERHHGTH